MVALRSFETSLLRRATGRNIPEDGILRRRHMLFPNPERSCAFYIASFICSDPVQHRPNRLCAVVQLYFHFGLQSLRLLEYLQTVLLRLPSSAVGGRYLLNVSMSPSLNAGLPVTFRLLGRDAVWQTFRRNVLPSSSW
jgi:hypothetical protein